MMKYLVLLCLLIASPLAAQSPMSATEFDAYTKGRTFYYGILGSPYGIEQYFDNQRVRWSFLDGNCTEGHWYEESGLICFVYEDIPDPQCWSFAKGDSGLIARFQGDSTQTELYEIEQSDEPMMCQGPKVGV